MSDRAAPRSSGRRVLHLTSDAHVPPSTMTQETTIPITPERWKAETKAVLERLADETYQRLAWFNKHQEVSSPDELINQLFDDFSFERFIQDEEIDLSHAQKAAARRFFAMVTRFCEGTPPTLNPETTIDDSRWAEIRNEAKELLRVLFP